MEELINLGLSQNTIRSMLEIIPEISQITKKDILEKTFLLKKVDCSELQILSIISSNPNYLLRTNGEIIDLIECLLKYGFKTLNILFDSNPFILSLEKFEIDNYINKRISNNELLEDIIDDLDSNPYLFSEV